MTIDAEPLEEEPMVRSVFAAAELTPTSDTTIAVELLAAELAAAREDALELDDDPEHPAIPAVEMTAAEAMATRLNRTF